MSNKYSICILVLLAISPVIQASTYKKPRAAIELHVGYNACSLSDFDQSYSNIFKNGFGIDREGTSINGTYIKGGSFRYFVTKEFAANLQVEVLALENKDILHDESLNKDTIVSNAVFYIAYVGIGPKYFFNISGFSFITPFIGINAGVYKHLGSYWQVQSPSGTSYYVKDYEDQKINFDDIFFGGNAEAGAEIVFGNNLGLTISGGYRLAKYTAEYKKYGVFTINDLAFTTIDYSGPYVSGGIVYYFGKSI